MEDKQTINPDEELDPKRLKFGMSPKEIIEAQRKAREKKKLPKKWRPQTH